MAVGAQLEIDDFDAFIDTLNDQSFILKKGPRLYMAQTSHLSQSRSQRW